MKTLKNVRKIINNNRLYSWMMVFIILVQAYSISASAGGPHSDRKTVLAREEFKLQLERRRQTLQDILEENPKVATSLGYIFLFISILVATGAVFLINYLIKRRDNLEMIPRTLDLPPPLWGLGEVLKIVILFTFFSHFFSAFAHILSEVTSSEGLDRRSGMVASTFMMDLLVLVFILRSVIDKHHQGIKALGISIKGLLKNIGVALYSYIGFLPILAIVFFTAASLAMALNYSPAAEPIYELIFEEKRPFLLAVISVLISIAGPIIEEIFFRGFLYGALRNRFGIFRAIFFSAFFFSLLHTNLVGFIPVLTLGMLLAYLKEKTGSLIPSIGVHMIHNSVLAALMFLLRGITS